MSALVENAFAWVGNELVVLTPAAATKIRRSRMSASTMKSVTKCAARWAFESVAPKTDDPFAATTLGTEMHTIYETFYDESKVQVVERVPELLEQMIRARADVLWSEDTLTEKSAVALRALAKNKEKWLKEITSRVMGILKIEDPQKVVVLQAHERADRTIVYSEEEGTKPISGLEYAAEGIEIAGIPFIGYIDRISVDGQDGDGIPFLIPEDYKSSKRVPWLKRGDSDDDGDQINIYAEVLRIVTGYLPEVGRLLYTKVGKAREINITERKVNKTIQRYVKAYSIMDKSCSTGAFEASETSFCGWCPLVDTCPVASLAGKDRAATNVNPVNLGIPTVRALGAPAPLDAEGNELPTVSEDSIVPATRTWEDMQDGKAKVQERVEETVIVAETVETKEAAPISEDPTMMEDERSADADERGGKTVSDYLILNPKEKVPYEEFAVDDSLNANAYASTAVFGLTELALETLVKEYGTNVGVGHIRALTDTFAKIVNRAYFRITGKRDGDPGISIWQSGLSVRIRGALRSVLGIYNDIPLLGGTDETWESWVESTVGRIVVIATIAVDTWETDHSENDDSAPWAVLVERGSGSPEAKKTITRRTAATKK